MNTYLEKIKRRREISPMFWNRTDIEIAEHDKLYEELKPVDVEGVLLEELEQIQTENERLKEAILRKDNALENETRMRQHYVDKVITIQSELQVAIKEKEKAERKAKLIDDMARDMALDIDRKIIKLLSDQALKEIKENLE